MTKRITISGFSDDLVEVEGSIRGEWGLDSTSLPKYLLLSTGDIFSINYDNKGMWRVKHVEDSGLCDVTITEAPEEEGDDGVYSDVALVLGPITWLSAWDEQPIASDDGMLELMQDMLTDLTAEQRMDIYMQMMNMVEGVDPS